MASALQLLFGLPVSIGYLISALVVIPLATHGITFISRFQVWTQPLWLVLQLSPFVFILYQEWWALDRWTQFPGAVPKDSGDFNVIFFGAASGVLFSLMAQIGEQVDFLRFLPEPNKKNRTRWWLGLIAAGPGWIVVGAIKILAGSFLAVLALTHGVPEHLADDPIQMYQVAFGYLTQSPAVALALSGIFVIICQLKINVTNAYAGSIAWSNFFSRLTHSHPGRVVWLVFNVIIALLLMELGVYGALENILGTYSNVAVAWVGALVADLVINKPLGYSPKHIEFKRAHLYDINPVGIGAMVSGSALGILSYVGLFGDLAQALSPYIALLTAFVVSPLIASATNGRYYIARTATVLSGENDAVLCKVCENAFEREDMALCPAYGGAICSLCCSLDARCHDQCKVSARFGEQLTRFVAAILPQPIALRANPRLLQFFGYFALITGIIAVLFWFVYYQVPLSDEDVKSIVASTLSQVFLLLLIVVGVLTWLFVLANESRQFALHESQRQTDLLSQEINAHEKTDRALQEAKDLADAANQAKSRYLSGLSHELRTPLNSMLGYAQLLEKDVSLSTEQTKKVRLIRGSGDHLADLIEGLLDISRIEAGRLELHREQVPLQELLEELTEMFHQQARAKGIRFEYIASSLLPDVVIADRKQLRQILTNLLSNAVKYTHQGTVTLAVRYRNQVAEFTIKDTGVGIESHEFNRIFRPFERIRKPGLPQAPGTGLGLTISQLLTDIMGGDISFDSVPGKGSTFRLSLMLFSVSEPAVRVQPDRRIESYSGAQKILMVVDDDASHRGLISEILSPLGFVVLEAPDAYACLDIFENTNVDLFFLDVSMPGMDGWELAKRLRKQGVRAPIIMISANALESEEDVRLNDDYLIKPIRDNALLDKVASALGLQWSYESDLHQSVDSAEPVQAVNAEWFQGVSDNDCRELIEMAELGFIEGLEKVLKRLEKTGETECFVALMRRHLDQYQFSEIVSINKKALL